MSAPVFIEGDDVTLRPVEESDLDFLHENINDPDVWHGLLAHRPRNRDAERAFVEEVAENDDAIQCTVYAEDDPVGVVGIHGMDRRHGTGELGYWVTPDKHQRGYGSAGAALLVGYAFDHLRLEHVTARVADFNEASQRLLESIGFVREGTLREHVFVDGDRRDVHLYGALADEWA